MCFDFSRRDLKFAKPFWFCSFRKAVRKDTVDVLTGAQSETGAQFLLAREYLRE
jgi:hypothetical protein